MLARQRLNRRVTPKVVPRQEPPLFPQPHEPSTLPNQPINPTNQPNPPPFLASTLLSPHFTSSPPPPPTVSHNQTEQNKTKMSAEPTTSASQPPSSSTSSSPVILYKPPTIQKLLRTAAINLVLPFINGLMLGFGELFAHELAFRWGWGGTRVFPSSRVVAAGVEGRDNMDDDGRGRRIKGRGRG